MISKKGLAEEIANLEQFQEMAEAFEEIAATRIKKIRESVLKSRYYVEDLNQIFSEVKVSYKKQIAMLMKKSKVKNPSKISFYMRNGRMLYVLISANTGLYGDLIPDTFNLFLDESSKVDCDVAIIGKQGLKLFLNREINRKYQYFDFPDNGIDDKLLKQIISYMLSYEKTMVFFAKFKSIATQEPEMTDISGNIKETEEQVNVTIKYFFEPSIEKILAFFEQEIFASIFEQTIRESQLAKLAARLVALDSSTENTRKKLNQATIDKNKLIHEAENKKQMQVFSSMRLWSR